MTGCSPSPACRPANDARRAPPMPSNGCTRSSSAASRPRPSCRRRRPQLCCFGRCSRPDRSPCARSTAGRRLPPNQPTRSLTSPPDPLTLSHRRRHHGIFHHIPDSTLKMILSLSRVLLFHTLDGQAVSNHHRDAGTKPVCGNTLLGPEWPQAREHVDGPNCVRLIPRIEKA